MRSIFTSICLSIFLLLLIEPIQAMSEFKKPSNEELKTKLTSEQYAVTQQCGTEPPFRNAYWNNHEDGIYVDVVTGEPLFSSKDKFDSGSGWPSFTKPIEGADLVEKNDSSHGMMRTEVKSKSGDSHLGHVFPDGPGPNKLRYCINSASLRFIPAAKLKEEGYAEYEKLFKNTDSTDGAKIGANEVATLAGGCFWGMEDLLRKLPGVVSIEVGYTGGKIAAPIYDLVSTGTTGHAEAVKIEFDPSKTSYEEILKFFFKIHDPTTRNRQGNDMGTQYRSAIFTNSDEQAKVAQKVIDEVNASGKWPKPIVTEIVPAGPWYKAEEYHQDYLQKHPGGYTCHYIRE